MLRLALAVLILFASPVFAPPAFVPPALAQTAARNLPLTAFFGIFRGGGVAESTDDPAFRTAMRDSQVEIRAAEGDGFRIAWSTTAPRGNPNQPTQKTKTTEMTFRAGSKPGLFEAVPQGNPLAGQDLAWARLRRQTLTIYSMTTASDGGYEMQKWDRTLRGTGMEMTYSRISDGEKTRTVRSRLTKEGR